MKISNGMRVEHGGTGSAKLIEWDDQIGQLIVLPGLVHVILDQPEIPDGNLFLKILQK